MSTSLDKLITLLTLEPIEDTIFRGQSHDLGYGRLFGGQVLGQALAAARQTVPDDRFVHSFHSYFLREGAISLPVIYQVDCVRNGRSFTTRRVTAIQKGKAIFTLMASFQIDEEGFSHQDVMPAVEPPEQLASEYAIRLAMAKQAPDSLKKRILQESPIDIRPVSPTNPYIPEQQPPINRAWFKTKDPLPKDNPYLHRCLLAYASDFQFLPTALYPHGVRFFQPELQVASLDHAMWFHRPFRMDEWLLYSVESPSASGARGLVHGQVFNQKGKLVASTTQEGLIRQRHK